MTRDELMESGVTGFKVEGENISLTARCDMVSMIGGGSPGTTPDLKACVLVGEHQQLKAIYAALVTNAKVTLQCMGKWVRRCEFGYRVQYEHLAGRWAVAHIHSQDPRIIWSGGVIGLTRMLARPDFEVPFLPEWVPYIGRQLKERGLIVEFDGFRQRGAMLVATDEVLDEIVTAGVKAGDLKVPGGKGSKPLDGLQTIEDYVTTFSVELAKKVADTMRPVHDPAVDSPHPSLAKLAPKLFPPQAHLTTACAKVLRKKRWTYLACNMGTGKAQPNDCNVLTPDGWKKIGDMQVGDRVMNPEGGTAKVVGVYPQGEKAVYRVEFTDGAAALCCKEHLWQVNTPTRKATGKKPIVLSVEEMQEKGLHYGGGNLRYYIPLVEPLEFNNGTGCDFNPYLLGYLLGDGCVSGKTVDFTTADQETVDRIALMVKERWNYSEMQVVSRGDIEYRITHGVRGMPNPLYEALEAMGLTGCKAEDKFIPDRMLHAERRARVALLQGLLDSDGYIETGANTIEYVTVSPRLRDGVIALVQSLGGVATYSTKAAPTYLYNGEARTGQPAYLVSIALPNGVQPFALARKLIRYKPKTKYHPTRGIKSIERCGEAECTCIKLDSANQLYITDQYVVTHNTPMGILECHLCAEMLGQKGYRAIVACPPHLVEKWAREIRKWLGALPTIEVITDWRHFMALKSRPLPKGPEWYVIAMTKAKLSYRRRAAAVRSRKMLQYEKQGKVYRAPCLKCPKCDHPITNTKNEPATLEDLTRKWLFCDRMVCRKCRQTYGATAKKCVSCSAALVKCGEAFWQADPETPKVSPADFGRHRMRNFFDFFIRDEAHHSKGADSLDGFACGALMKMARRVVLMTGTFLAGKCEDIRPILFKSLPHLFVPRGFGWKDELEFAHKYGRVDTIERSTSYKDGSEDRRSGRGSNKSVTQVVRPGIMPRIFADFCAEHVAFLSLHELASNLPTYSEHTFNVDMDGEQRRLYDAMKEELLGWFRSFYATNRRLAMKLLGPMLEALLTWPDDPRGWEEISVYDDLKEIRIPILTPPAYEPEGLLPKEERLVAMVKEEKALGRKCWIYAVRDDTRARLHKILRDAGLNVAHLLAAVEPLRRERWIRENAMTCDVGLCHPELVETGLELFDPAVAEFNFPTLVWYSTGFKLNTLRQASRRVWRIGQTRQCKTNYLYYGGSAQQEAIALMGKKLVSAEAIEGKFSDGGLVDESGDADLALSVAKNLANNIKSKVVQTWKPVQGLQTHAEKVKFLADRMGSFKQQLAAAKAKQPQLF